MWPAAACQHDAIARTTVQTHVDRRSETHAQIHAHAIVQRRAHHVGVVRKVEVGQEAERAESEGHDWRHDALEEPGAEEHSAVAAELCGGEIVSADEGMSIDADSP